MIAAQIRVDYASGKRGAMSALTDFVRGELARQNMSQQDLAERSGIADATLSRILNEQVDEPKGGQIARIAKALGIPFWKLMQIAGYTTETPDDPDDEQRRIAAVIAADPTLRPVMDGAAKLSRANRQAILVSIELLLRQQNELPPAPEDQ